MNLLEKVNQIKDLIKSLNLDEHPEGWKAESNKEGIIFHLDWIEDILSCPDDKTVCQNCHEYIPKHSYPCPNCGDR